MPNKCWMTDLTSPSSWSGSDSWAAVKNWGEYVGFEYNEIWVLDGAIGVVPCHEGCKGRRRMILEVATSKGHHWKFLHYLIHAELSLRKSNTALFVSTASVPGTCSRLSSFVSFNMAKVSQWPLHVLPNTPLSEINCQGAHWENPTHKGLPFQSVFTFHPRISTIGWCCH